MTDNAESVFLKRLGITRESWEKTIRDTEALEKRVDIEQNKIITRLEAEEEAGRIAEAEHQRKQYHMSLVCSHRETRQWIESGEFWLCVCPSCAGLLIDALCEVR